MRALITGASAGMGREMALLLAEQGWALTLVARREDALQALADALPVDVQVIAADLSDRTACFRVWEAARGDDLALVVNNAGFGLFGAFAESDLDTELSMIDLNITALHILTKLALRDFRARGSGCILNMASSAGFLAGPLMSTYYATKGYVLRLTQAIREELRREGCPVQICCFCPGPVRTDFNVRAQAKDALPGLSAKKAAKAALNGAFAGRGVIVPGAMMRLSLLASKLCPESALVRLTYSLQKRKAR